jgi:hypothetical protein
MVTLAEPEPLAVGARAVNGLVGAPADTMTNVALPAEDVPLTALIFIVTSTPLAGAVTGTAAPLRATYWKDVPP